MKQKKEVRYINSSTGEYTTKRSYVDMMFDDEKGYLLWARKNSVRTFLDIPLPDVFTKPERADIYDLRHYILRDNQLLAYRSNGVIKPIKAENISAITDTGIRRTRKLLCKCKKYGVLKEISIDGMTWYMYNPIYGLRAKRLTITMYIVFQDELKDVLPDWVKDKFLQQVKEATPNIRILS